LSVVQLQYGNPLAIAVARAIDGCSHEPFKTGPSDASIANQHAFWHAMGFLAEYFNFFIELP
jgi:hypothetical protein